MNINENASYILMHLMSKTESQREEFTRQCMEVLTLCMSELIRASYCPSHYQDGIDEMVKQIKEDLKL